VIGGSFYYPYYSDKAPRPPGGLDSGTDAIVSICFLF